ncbi:hypothetical protein LOTGIDRAFT_224543 [Lottia gigantea]|uniref:Serine/threonine-protein phosphatase 2A activator n=1 Tax=Lottia gigantea TaxID=225164 RepID=V4CLQ6_LOTGI|nr:hypothetical protein LOTGIDRAFT_224543 [Lottia gigantea]ESP03240.1 hypothetical protein LOTGIDRAFT_224543 [Lottia gigantea]
MNSESTVSEGKISYQPIDVANHNFMKPVKQLSLPEHLPKWEKSKAYTDLLGLILTLNQSVKGKKMTDEYHVSKEIEKQVEILETLDKWLDEIPPVDQPQRFGNTAFRDWLKKIQDNIEDLLKCNLEEKFHPAIIELSTYFIESFGNSTRIDYGSGHEMAFAAYLCCLFKIGAFKEEDFVACVLKLFQRYMNLVRKCQTQYRMEPAGSHGVWSLDDYQFIPFIWGSSQLIDHKRIKPKSFTEPYICSQFAKDFMFLGCIEYINKVKNGPFAEHSNTLWGISAVPHWTKVNSGLIKMYKAEVLAKFPVIQHFLFGSLLSIDPVS